MKKKSSVSLGPGAASLILIIVVLSLTALGMLSLMTARNDLKLSRRSAEVAQAVYELSEHAERDLNALDDIVSSARGNAQSEEAFWESISGTLPDGMSFEEDDIIAWQVTDDTRVLDCAVRVRFADEDRLTWTRHALTSEIAADMEEFD